KVCPQLSKAVRKELADLGFKQSRFEIQMMNQLASSSPREEKRETGEKESMNESISLRRRLQDEVEFQFSPNPGEPLRPLRAIASSGEMARVMLALKTVLAKVDQVPVLIFDE